MNGIYRSTQREKPRDLAERRGRSSTLYAEMLSFVLLNVFF